MIQYTQKRNEAARRGGQDMEEERIVRVREAVAMTGLSRVTLWRMGRAGTFPPAVRLGERATGYRLSEILEWIKSRPAA